MHRSDAEILKAARAAISNLETRPMSKEDQEKVTFAENALLLLGFLNRSGSSISLMARQVEPDYETNTFGIVDQKSIELTDSMQKEFDEHVKAFLFQKLSQFAYSLDWSTQTKEQVNGNT